jgi:hypothetical protein
VTLTEEIGRQIKRKKERERERETDAEEEDNISKK